MKTIFRFLGLAVLAFALGTTAILAQDAPAAANPCENPDAGNALYEKVTTNYAAKDSKTLKIAIDAAEEYLKTYGACEWAKDQVTWLNGFLPNGKVRYAALVRDERLKVLFDRFDPAVKAGNWDEVYASGKEILSVDAERVAKNDAPNGLNQILIMGSIGLDETLKTPRNLKYNDDTLRYARMAIEKLNAGKTSSTFGFHTFTYVVRKDPKDPKSPVDNAASKENALGWLNYTIGAITYYGQNNKKDALPYLYKASQASSDTKKVPQIYGILGDYYRGEVARLGEEIKNKTIAAGNKDTDETKGLIAQLKAYAERGIDAYGRGQKLVDPVKEKKYYDSLGTAAEELYKVRFQKPDGFKEFVAAQIAKPLPDPSTVPTPIVEVEPDAVPTTTGTTTAPTTTPAGTTGTGTKPATTPATTPATNGTKPAATPATNGTKPSTTAPNGTKKPVSATDKATPSGTTSAAAAKKPVVKKKGTR